MEKRRICTNIIIIVSAISLLVTSGTQSMVIIAIEALNIWFAAAFGISNFRIIVEDNEKYVEKRIKEENDRKN